MTEPTSVVRHVIPVTEPTSVVRHVIPVTEPMSVVRHVIPVTEPMSVADLAKTVFFCLTLGQTGTGFFSDPWPLCLSHHFFCNIV